MASDRSPRTVRLAFAVSAALTLLLSPITVIYTAVIGLAGLGVTLTVYRGRTTVVPVAVFGGLVTGSLPYLIGGLVIGAV